MPRQPIKRHIALQPISRDHHQSLLLGWKIRTGLRLNVSADRIYKYLSWFYTNYMKQHFSKEERYLFPILGDHHEKVIRAKKEHHQIHEFFHQKKVTEEDISMFEKLLTAHVRFEERDLFNLIQEQANSMELENILNQIVDQPFVENMEDEFWIIEKRNNNQ